MNPTYTVKLRTQCNMETKASNMEDTVRKAVEFLREIPCNFSEEWYELEVIDNLTELTVFKQRRIK